MSRQQSGFTLIELIIVVVILGALAVVALPRFVDLEQEAQEAAVEGVAGNISSAFATNFAGALADASGARSVVDGDTIAISGGSFSPDILTNNDLNDYEIGTCSAPGGGTGSTTTCTVRLTDDNSVSADFEVIATD